MSDLSVITTSNAPAPPSRWAQRKALFDQLGQALQAGDLQAAQDAPRPYRLRQSGYRPADAPAWAPTP